MSDSTTAACAMTSEPGPLAVCQGRGAALRMAAIVFALGLLSFLPFLGASPLSGTEGHRALSAHHMLVSGNWLIPNLFGRIYLFKPPMHYWLQAISEACFGANSFAWRLPAALEGALLASMLCWFGCRWFGKLGGLVTGLAYLGMYTLWGEDRGAELDASNTFFALMATLCWIELHFWNRTQPARRRAILTLICGLAMGASFLSKGPAALTIFLGVLLWSLWQNGPRWLLKPGVWSPYLIGVICFGAWALSGYFYLKHNRLPMDLSGVKEGLKETHPANWQRVLGALVLPLSLWAYALPVSLVLPLSCAPDVVDAGNRRLVRGLAGALLISWGIGVITGMHTPRYGFVTLPLLCPLAGAVAANRRRMPEKWQTVLAAMLIAAGGIWLGVMGFLSFRLRHQNPGWAIVVTAMAAVVMAATCEWFIHRKDWRATIGFVAVMLLATLPFAWWKNHERFDRSCQPQGLMMRGIVAAQVNAREPLLTCHEVLDQPELFYYAGVPTLALNGSEPDWWKQISPGRWVVLTAHEYEAWRQQVPSHLTQVHPFIANQSQVFLLWYE